MQDPNLTKTQISEILDNHKAVDITTLDVSHLTDITEWIIICSATSSRHAKTLADKLISGMRDHGVRPLGIEGQDPGEWVLIDFDSAVVHIMLPEQRKLYDLEKLWGITEEFRKQKTGSLDS